MASTIDIALTDADYGLLLTALHTHEQLATHQSGSPDPLTAERWRDELRRTQALAGRVRERRSEFAISEVIIADVPKPIPWDGSWGRDWDTDSDGNPPVRR